MNAALLAAYRRTTFTASTPSGTLSIRIGQFSIGVDDLCSAHSETTWAYVTAFNPGSVLLSQEENRKRQRELERVVTAQGFPFYSGEGIAGGGGWPPERSLLIVGMGRAAAVRLGQCFGQCAVVYGEVGQQAELLVCETGCSEEQVRRVSDENA